MHAAIQQLKQSLKSCGKFYSTIRVSIRKYHQLLLPKVPGTRLEESRVHSIKMISARALEVAYKRGEARPCKPSQLTVDFSGIPYCPDRLKAKERQQKHH